MTDNNNSNSNNHKYANVHIRTFVVQPVGDGPCYAVESNASPPRCSSTPPWPKKARRETDDAANEPLWIPICHNLRACIAKWGLTPPYLRSEDQEYWASYYAERSLWEHRHPNLRPRSSG